MSDGLPQSNNGISGTAAATSAAELLAGVLRSSARDSKVIFGALRGTFDLDRNEIENFFHIVDQRLNEQNKCKASACEVAVYYSDGTSRKFPSIASFSNYSETRNRFPTVLTVHFAYFVQFPDADGPEKQEIDIVIRSSESTSETIDIVATDSQFRMSGDKIQVMPTGDSGGLGVISYTINHTRISWGLDLEGHIKAHIEQRMEKPTTTDRVLRAISGPLNIFTTLFVGLYIANLIIDAFFSFLYQTNEAKSLTDYSEVAAQYLLTGQIAKYVVASLVVSVVFFVLFSGLVSRLTKSMRRPKPSFITLSTGDEKRRDARLKQYSNRWTSLAATLGSDILVALLLLVAEDRFGYLIGLGH